ncbi:SRPBCC family protein [Streptomyces griseosporeus]|uniref:SRPBCC family protein n=1 Tax=Streptomyces griseosporeus TaxID=1910 RepID=UPI00378CB8F6
MIDVTRQIDAVGRRVGRRTLEAGEVRAVTLAQRHDVPVEDVWGACTDPERIPRWFLPVEGELRTGGRYQLQGNAGGTIERCDPPKSFFATWEYGGDTSWVELRLTPEGDGRTRLELDHLFPLDDEKWADFGPGAVGVGWDMTFAGLFLHLSTGRPNDPEAFMAWAASAEGRRFVTASSEGWYAASVASGEDEPRARARADRTTAAYTGEAG